MIPVTFDITRPNVSGQETIQAYVQVVPRLGETVFLRIGKVRVTTQVLEVIHLPALNLNSFPSVSIKLKILREQQLQAARTQAA